MGRLSKKWGTCGYMLRNDVVSLDVLLRLLIVAVDHHVGVGVGVIVSVVAVAVAVVVVVRVVSVVV